MGPLDQAPTKSLPPAGECRTCSRPVDGSLHRQPRGAGRYQSQAGREHTHPTSLPFACAREALGVRVGGWAGFVAFEEHPVLLEVRRDLSAGVCRPLDEAA